MKQFSGFPARMRFTPVPNLFFSSLLPQINDIAELKTTLHIFRTIYAKKGYPRCVSYRELLADKSLVLSLKDKEDQLEATLTTALEMAINRGTILHLAVVIDGKLEDIYFINTESDRRTVAKIENGELTDTGLVAVSHPRADFTDGELPNIFTRYGQNVGMLTPMIAEELREAEKLYPEAWIRDAIRKAVSLNKRNWRYIDRILERWSTEGRSDGTYRRDFKKTEPDKYSKQKYGHMVKR